MVSRVLLVLLIALCSTSAFGLSYSEVYAGFAVPTGVSSNDNQVADQLDIGGLGTTIQLVGLFPMGSAFALAPAAAFLATSSTTSAIELGQNNQLDFRQGDLALDLLVKLPQQQRMLVGAGAAYGWWNAATKQRVDYYRYPEQNSNRYARGQAWMARGVVNWFLRDPKRAGVSLRGVVALPVTSIMDETAWAATGYVGVGVGFSMPLR